MWGLSGRFLLWLATVALGLPLAHGAKYYVSPGGSDGAAGTFDQPFQTIQKAASVMVAGDTAYIRAGVYRETVTPANSGTQSAPITFKPYNGESVTVSGADVIPAVSWVLDSGKIYKTPLAWDLGEGNNQVFHDGQMMIEARWPNATLDLSHPTIAMTTGGSFVPGGSARSTGTITAADLPSRPAGYWNGARINISMGAGWVWQTGTVIDSPTGNAQLSFAFTEWSGIDHALVPTAKNPFYLWGKLSELDTVGEWYFDSAASTLYFWTPSGDNPAQHVVEAKRRQLAFDLSGRSHVTIQGLNIFAATIMSAANSSYLLLDGLKAEYLSHFTANDGADACCRRDHDSGIIMTGTNNVLRNSEIAWSAGVGVLVDGNGHRVFNNVIHEIDYTPNDNAPIQTGFIRSAGVVIAWNTIYNAARGGMRLDPYGGGHFQGKISHNQIHDIGLQTKDLGCIYTWHGDGLGTEISYNICHDNPGIPSCFYSPGCNYLTSGIYLDNDSSNFVVHHNLVWNTPNALGLNQPSINNKIYNNTFDGTVLGAGGDGLSGTPLTPPTELKNNIFTVPIDAGSGGVRANNILPGTDPEFVDRANHNYQLQPTSPAVAAGAIIPPYTDGYSGPAPDIGAFDHTKLAWKAGPQAAAYTASAAGFGPALAPGALAYVAGTAPFAYGVSVLVTDGAGVDLPVKVLYTMPSPPMLFFEVPGAAAPGVALITITNPDGAVSLSSAPVFTVAPGLFSADGSGQGIAAAQILRVKAGGAQSVEPVFRYDAATRGYVALPIDLTPTSDRVTLLLYGTGIRGRSALSGVIVTIGGVSAQPSYAGPLPTDPAVDQISVPLASNLEGKGSANIVLTVDGQPANIVTVTLK